jgi:hypothetical protein
MNSYGPPQVFKIVWKNGGWDNGFINLSEQKLNRLCSSGCEHLFESVRSLQDVDLEKEALMQSTGYKDKTGADVFFGDKLVDDDGVIWTVVYKGFTGQVLLENLEPGSKTDTYQVMASTRQMQTIGNIYTPRAELMRAAEGVKNA